MSFFIFYEKHLQLLYGSGLRISECLRLRIKDIDLGTGVLVVRKGKGDHYRTTVLPGELKIPLFEYIKRRKAQHNTDLQNGYGEVHMPPALARKYPNASKELGGHSFRS